MTGIEATTAIQLVDACIGIGKTILDVGRAVRDARGLPPQLRDLIDQLPAIEELLESAHDSFEGGRVSETASRHAQPVLGQCERALGELRDLFRKACPKEGETRGRRVWKGARTVFVGRESQVTRLLGGIQMNLAVLEQREVYVIGGRLEKLREATEALGRDGGESFTNSGAGNLFANCGGTPTNNVVGGTNNRQVISPGVYHEAVSSYRYTNYLGNVNIGRSTGDKSAETALLEAAANGQDNRVTRILREDVHIDHRDPQGRTALHLAAQFGHEHIARALLSAGCDIDASSRSYGTPICLAALKQHQAIFELLLDRGADIRSLDSAGSLGSLLHAASMGGTVAIVARLVSSGLPVNTFRTVHLNFMEAVLKQKCVSEIMKHGEQCQQGSFTPLQVAAGTGDAEVVACLLWAGADVNAQGRIWSAKGLCNYEDAKESYPGCTPLLMVCLAERINGRADHRYEVLQVLLMHGADIHHCPSWALPLQGAAGTGQVSSIETLARLGVDVNKANQNNGFTPLMYAACTGELAAVRKLIELGADLTARDKDGDTAGMIAKNMNQVDCYRVLESASASAWNTSRGGRKS